MAWALQVHQTDRDPFFRLTLGFFSAAFSGAAADLRRLGMLHRMTLDTGDTVAPAALLERIRKPCWPGIPSAVFGVSACMLLAGSIVFGRQQDRELSGIHGIPVEGHTVVGGIEIVGTKQLDLSRSGWHKLRDRLVANGADLRLGWPLESPTLCRFKEVLRGVMAEKGFLDVEIDLETRPTQGNRRHLTLKFTIVEGHRSRRPVPAAPLLSPAERCMR